MSDLLTRVPGIIRTAPLEILEMVKYACEWGQHGAAELARPEPVRARQGC